MFIQFIQFEKQIFTRHRLCSRYRWLHFAIAPTLSHFLSVSFHLLWVLYNPSLLSASLCFKFNFAKKKITLYYRSHWVWLKVHWKHSDLFGFRYIHCFPPHKSLNNLINSEHLNIGEHLPKEKMCTLMSAISCKNQKLWQHQAFYFPCGNNSLNKLALVPETGCDHSQLRSFCLLSKSLCTGLFQRSASKQQKMNDSTCHWNLSVFYMICLTSGSFLVCPSWSISC